MAEHVTITSRSWIKWLIVGITVVLILVIAAWATVKGLELKYKYSPAKADAAVIDNGRQEVKIVTVTETTAEQKADVEATTVTTEAAIEKTTETTIKAVEEGKLIAFYETEGGIPYNGTEWNVDVAPGEIEVFTFGPGEVNGIAFKGGSKPDIGNIAILLPDPKGEKVVSYIIKDVIAGANWHGATQEKDWRLIINDRVKAMKEAPNGPSGLGCQIVNVIVVQGDSIIYQGTFEK